MIIIPDVHGRIFWEYPLFDNQDKHWGEHFIFLGDYLDPCPRENLPPDFAFWNLQNILEWKINDPDMITLLLGNHDLHYLGSRAISSRFDSEHQGRNRELLMEHASLFQLAAEAEVAGRKFLFTHAGVLSGWLEYNKRELPTDGKGIADTLNAMWADRSRWQDLFALMDQVPYCRAGHSAYGSPVWADVSEMALDRADVPGYYQIFGHTRQWDGPLICEHFACLDCCEPFRLTEEGKIERLEENDSLLEPSSRPTGRLRDFLKRMPIVF